MAMPYISSAAGFPRMHARNASSSSEVEVEADATDNEEEEEEEEEDGEEEEEEELQPTKACAKSAPKLMAPLRGKKSSGESSVPLSITARANSGPPASPTPPSLWAWSCCC